MSLTAAQREQLFKIGLGHGGGGGSVLRAHAYMADQYKQVTHMADHHKHRAPRLAVLALQGSRAGSPFQGLLALLKFTGTRWLLGSMSG